MAKKFDEHLFQKKAIDFDRGRMICMCETHKKRIGYCKCEDINPFIPHSVRIWGCYDHLIKVFTEQEVIEALKDYS